MAEALQPSALQDSARQRTETRSPSRLMQRLLCLLFGIVVVLCVHLQQLDISSGASISDLADSAHNSGAQTSRLGYK